MNGPDIRTSLPGPKAQAIIERDAKVVSTSYTRDYPLVIARGEGASSRTWTATSSSTAPPASP